MVFPAPLLPIHSSKLEAQALFAGYDQFVSKLPAYGKQAVGRQCCVIGLSGALFVIARSRVILQFFTTRSRIQHDRTPSLHTESRRL